jgi:glycosyltransferase involved in cell wall biosynthesis
MTARAAVPQAGTGSDESLRGAGVPGRAPRLLFVITVDWFFISHFLNRAVAAQRAGYDVVVVTHLESAQEQLAAAGLRSIHWRVRRRSLNPFAELHAFQQLLRIYRAEQPDLVHHIALKPILLGSLAARILGIRRVLNAPVGMGFVFSSNALLARTLRPMVRVALRALLNPPGSRVVFENRDDRAAALAQHLVREQDAALVRGAGVDTGAIMPVRERPGRPRVALVARMLWDKGVGDFVDAVRLLRARGVDAEFRLVGGLDPDNRACIDAAKIRGWQAEGIVDWLGHRDDVPAILADSHIVALPSYREGLPKALLEALAAGRPIIATDVPGCREVVIPGETGFLVPPRDAPALADALARLIQDPVLRRRFGAAGRRLAEQEFATELVERATLDLYARMLGRHPGECVGSNGRAP